MEFVNLHIIHTEETSCNLLCHCVKSTAYKCISQFELGFNIISSNLTQ